MNRTILILASLIVFAVGCGEDIFDTTEPIGPITYTPSNQMEQGEDECDFFNPGQPDGTFEIFIDGSDASLTHIFEVNTQDGTETIVRTSTTSNYDPTDDTVIFTTSRTNTEFPPCEVEITETYTVDLTNTEVSLDQNNTLEATLNHTETELSTDVCYPNPNDPADQANLWFVPLPCTSLVDFTLTRDPQL